MVTAPVSRSPIQRAATAGRRWSAPRTPAFWLLCGMLALCVLLTVVYLVFVTFLTPSAALVAMPMIGAYAAVFLLLVLRWGDPVERRPAWVVVTALLWGGTASCVVGAGSGWFSDIVVAKAVSPSFAVTWGPGLLAPTVEEAAKAAGLVLLLLAARPYLTTVWSGALYGAVIGIGFTATEDVGYALISADEALPDDVAAAVRISLLRFLVPGFAGHPLFTAAAGAGIAYAWLRRDASPRRRIGVLAAGLAGAWLMHFAVNAPLGPGAAEALTEHAGFGLLTGYLLVIAAAAVLPMWCLIRLRRADARVVLGRPAAVDPAAIPPASVEVLSSVRRRAREIHVARAAGGPEAARAVRRAQDARLRLAAAVSRPYRGYSAASPSGWISPPVQQALTEVRALNETSTTAAAGEIAPVAETGPIAELAPAPTSPGSRLSWLTRSRVGLALLVGALGGLAFWPLGAAVGAACLGVTGWLWRRGEHPRRLLAAGLTAGLFGGFTVVVNVVVNVLYPS